MVNYKRVVCEVAVLALLAAATSAAPAHDCNQYDQRQNGTDNIRVNIDGVVIAIAPADAFAAAASDINLGDLLEELQSDFQKPKPPTGNSPLKPEESKPDVVKPQETQPQVPGKPEAPLSDVSVEVVRPETKGNKKDASRKQVKGQRLKTLLANMLVPLLRRAHTHEN